MALLFDGNGMLVSLSRGDHVGFFQANPEAVDELHRQLRQHGPWSFACRSPGGLVVEVPG